ncbi:hypothetical protein C900_00666 [Fulvivirga imtechensis AK7]|uniref:Uncharacterized protein n=1 Tax=Fulvivirga imtechensis AK7 TaxID=1237149 RepID=L8JHB1_9BACT|nr:hypothetical protein C900_00666 [Fulvivirga imtechensis AK7]
MSQLLPWIKSILNIFSVALRKFQDDVVVYDFCYSSAFSVVNDSVMSLSTKSTEVVVILGDKHFFGANADIGVF